MKIPYYLYLISIYAQVMCEDNGIVKSKNPLPYFRRKVEELTEDTTIQSTLSDDIRNNLVSFLIKNVKKIYNELDEVSQVEQSTSVCTSTKENILEQSSPVYTLAKDDILVDNAPLVSDLFSENPIDSNSNNDTKTSTPTLNEVTTVSHPSRTHSKKMAIQKNVTLVHFSDKEINDVELSTTTYELTEKEELMHLSKNLISYETDRKQRDNELQPLITYGNGSAVNSDGTPDRLRSCIICNNVAMEDCSDPKNRLIPATVCERDDDLCYSQHTPFGVIDRGCFNANHNLTTYVCSCNLCNYVSISEMPYIFYKKRDWVDNVLELSRTRYFRKSVYKDMSCLKCESNATAKSGDMLDTANCLEGNIGSLPTEECKDDEVCAVKAIRHDGYLWRGCVKSPLYNYWWALCDSDLCNYDTVISMYDVE